MVCTSENTINIWSVMVPHVKDKETFTLAGEVQKARKRMYAGLLLPTFFRKRRCIYLGSLHLTRGIR